MPARLRDVAAAAGVSVKTVSNVVNNYQFVKHDTRARVLAAINELDYRPNLSARRLRTGRSNLIALSVPEIQAPYFAELASEIVEAAESHGWTVLIDRSGGQRSEGQRTAARLRADLVDGAIASPLSITAEDARELTDANHPLVLLGEQLPGVDASYVAIDDFGAAAAATRHLIELGRTSIAAIGEPGQRTGALRLRGFLTAMAETGRPVDPRLVLPVERHHRQDGYAAMVTLLSGDSRPDAVFCFNDLLALGAIRAVVRAGLNVPRDIAVVGFDDIEDGRYSTPSLTTVSPDKAGIARAAVDLLGRRFDAPAASGTEEIRVSYRLIVRESTALYNVRRLSQDG
jgi:DNA-binding LacI/PurR family transcriptional regulator